jgi:polysaccharide export outer membrane protein
LDVALRWQIDEGGRDVFLTPQSSGMGTAFAVWVRRVLTMKRFVVPRTVVLAAIAAGAVVLASFSAPAAAQESEAAPPAAPAPVAAAGPIDEGYILGVGDKVKMTVFGEANLSGDFAVDSTGHVALPLVGDIKAEGLSLRAFERRVEEALKEGYLQDPRVAAEVLNFRPYYILGEVARPGTYPYISGLTVYNAVATAGGFTYRANQGSVRIKRQGEEKEMNVDLTPNLQLQPGDTIRIKERWF